MFPAKDEVKFIKKSISIAKKVPGVKEIIVVDGMSSDGTPEIASKSGANYVLSPV